MNLFEAISRLSVNWAGCIPNSRLITVALIMLLSAGPVTAITFPTSDEMVIYDGGKPIYGDPYPLNDPRGAGLTRQTLTETKGQEPDSHDSTLSFEFRFKIQDTIYEALKDNLLARNTVELREFDDNGNLTTDISDTVKESFNFVIFGADKVDELDMTVTFTSFTQGSVQPDSATVNSLPEPGTLDMGDITDRLFFGVDLDEVGHPPNTIPEGFPIRVVVASCNGSEDPVECLAPTEVPEPSTGFLLGLGILSFVFVATGKRHRTKLADLGAVEAEFVHGSCR